MKYKVGDRVRIKSLDWYNENKNKIGFICFDRANFIPEMSRYCGEILIINRVVEEFEQYLVSECAFSWTDEMIEGLVEGIEDRMKELRKMCTISLTDSNYSDKVEVLLNDYEYIEENGKAYFVKKKKGYPKTYEECCKVLNTDDDSIIDISVPLHYNHLLISFTQLLIARDAYWKIAGEEMGLGKPWELSIGIPIYYIYYNRTLGTIKKDYADDIQGNVILAFPTAEMRDAFKENFDPDIEICKEFL